MSGETEANATETDCLYDVNYDNLTNERNFNPGGGLEPLLWSFTETYCTDARLNMSG